MSVYYKFKSAKDYDCFAIDGHFVSVGHLKEKIFELKHLGKGTDFDLVVTNAQTNEDYSDDGQLIPKNTSVLIRRVPGRSRRPLVNATSFVEQEEFRAEKSTNDIEAVNSSFAVPESSSLNFAEDLELDVFGTDLYAIPETAPSLPSIPVSYVPLVSKEDEENKIKALIETPALDWQQNSDGFGLGRGFARGIGGRMIGGRGFGRGGYENKTPPQGYICHRCKVPGHFIQHCPTNGDPNFDIKRVKPPTGIPKSMLVPTPDGSYALPSGAVAVLKPNEAAFEKEIEGMPSTRAVGDLPPEFHCPLCKEVMKDAVLTSKCCFTSFCDKCIRDHIINKLSCVCGATSVLADDLLPNKTLRDTINRILESNNNSCENGGSAFHVQDMESRNPQAKIPSPTQSAASKGLDDTEASQKTNDVLMISVANTEDKIMNGPPVVENLRTPGIPDVSEGTRDSKTIKEASQESNPFPDEEVQQKPVPDEIGKKKKKKKLRVPPGAQEMQWRPPTTQDHMYENYMMPMGPATFNPYWNGGVQPGFDGFMPPYGNPMPYMGYGAGPVDVAFGGMMPHMMPYPPPPPRDHSEHGMGGFNGPPPPMSREEFEARKADLKRKRENEMRIEKEQQPKDRDHRREGSGSTSRSKSQQYHEKSEYSRRSSPSGTRRKERPPTEGESRYHQKQREHDRDRKGRSESPPIKGSVFSRISLPDHNDSKSRKVSSSSREVGSDEERHLHYKRHNDRHRSKKQR